MLGEGLARDEAAHALADADGAVLEDDLALADDHQRGPVALGALEDVVLRSLPAGTTAVPSRLPARPRAPHSASTPPQVTGTPQGSAGDTFVKAVTLRCKLFHLRGQPLATGHLG